MKASAAKHADRAAMVPKGTSGITCSVGVPTRMFWSMASVPWLYWLSALASRMRS